MEVVVVSGVPARLRGSLTRWFLEIATGVFVGNVSARVRDQIWELIENEIGTGQALLIYSAQNEQHLEFKSIGHKRQPVDMDGIFLMREAYRNQDSPSVAGSTAPPRESWSIAARRNRFRK